MILFLKRDPRQQTAGARCRPPHTTLVHLATRLTRHVDQLPPVVRKIVEVTGADVGRRLTLKELAKVVSRSPSHLNVMFRRATGITIRQYALWLRMRRAEREIELGVKIDAVALLVGFRSRKNFYRQFEAWFGAKPTDFRVASRSHAPETSRERSPDDR